MRRIDPSFLYAKAHCRGLRTWGRPLCLTMAASSGIRLRGSGLVPVVLACDGPFDDDAQGPNLRPQTAARDTEDACGLHLVAGGMSQDAGEELTVEDGD